MNPTIENAITNFQNSKDRLVRAFESTADDRLNWSPSPTARTPIQIVAHAAAAIHALNETMDGRPFAPPTSEVADRGFLEWEKQFTTKEQALIELNRNSDAFVAWLKVLPEEKLGDMVKLPFDLGYAPMAMVITFPVMHTDSHTPQIEYIQTIYGDRIWH